MKKFWTVTLAAVMSLAAQQTVYIGTRSTEGIYRMQFDPATGAIRDVKVAAKTLNPTFLAVHPTRPLVFAVVAAPEGKVGSFAVEPDGGLRLLNEVSSKERDRRMCRLTGPEGGYRRRTLRAEAWPFTGSRPMGV